MADGSRAPARLSGDGLTLAYSGRTVAEHLDVAIPDGSFTVIVGPNACGKSTLLRALSRLLPLRAGHVVLDGADIRSYPAKEVARRLGLLPQAPVAPDDITVRDLVARGRYPHQSILRQWSRADQHAVAEAMQVTGVADLAARPADQLSGGQRQRVWIAMVLAQETSVLLLDEPTTFLDIAHQLEVMELMRSLHREGRTLVAVLHDLNQACRYATHLIAMKSGRVVAEGAPARIVDAALIKETFGIDCVVIDDPCTGTPLVVPTPPD